MSTDLIASCLTYQMDHGILPKSKLYFCEQFLTFHFHVFKLDDKFSRSRNGQEIWTGKFIHWLLNLIFNFENEEKIQI